MGMTSSAPMMLCKALKLTFSRATAHSGKGHMTRSSISRVMSNSVESGRATEAMPVNMMATAMRPGSRMVPKLAPAAAVMGLALPPMRGRMKVKTNRNSSGCMPTRSRKGTISRVSTRRSRRNRPQKALRKNVELLTQVPPCEADKDGFQARLGNGQVAQAVAGSSLHQQGQQAVGAGGNDAQ